MSVQQYLPIASIRRRGDARPLDEASVLTLMDSIKLSSSQDLLNPINVRASGDGWELIAGGHRLEAMTRLGETEILSSVFDLDDAHAELAMIDENLCRAELSPADRASQTARRKAIYVALHPETRREATLKRGDEAPSRQLGETRKADRFTAETAAATSRSERSIQRDAERGEKIAPEAIAEIRGTPNDRGSYLDEIKQVPRERQVEKVRHDLAGPARPRTPSAPPAAAPKRQTPPVPAAAEMVRRFIVATDELAKIDFDALAAGAPLNMRANLQGRCRPYIERLTALDDALEARRT